MRSYGEGRVFLRGRVYHIAYCRNGHEFSESAKTADKKKARKLLAKRLGQIEKPDFVGPSERRLTLDDLEAEIVADYERHGKRSVATAKYCLKPVKEFFKHDKLVEITRPRIQEYQTERLRAGMARATVNREVRYLLRGFKLLVDGGRFGAIPRVGVLKGENVREGFLNKPEFEAMVEHLRPEVGDLVRFLYNSAWRSGEALKLEWSKVDVDDWIVRLSRKNEKTKNPRTLPLVGELREVIENRIKARQLDCPYVFHRSGKVIKSFRNAFKAACVKVGLGRVVEDEQTGKVKYIGITPHDMRRSAIRNFRKAGVSESEGMKISGHRTNSVYKRYDIIDEEDQRNTMEKVQEHQRREMEKLKVVPIKRAG
jgi:integrase